MNVSSLYVHFMGGEISLNDVMPGDFCFVSLRNTLTVATRYVAMVISEYSSIYVHP